MEELLAIVAQLDAEQRRILLEYIKYLYENSHNCCAWFFALGIMSWF